MGDVHTSRANTRAVTVLDLISKLPPDAEAAFCFFFFAPAVDRKKKKLSRLL